MHNELSYENFGMQFNEFFSDVMSQIYHAGQQLPIKCASCAAIGHELRIEGLARYRGVYYAIVVIWVVELCKSAVLLDFCMF